MTILAGDIKLVASQVMDDVPEGGGAATANVIADGVSNAVFTDISELDRAGGRVNLRKLFAHIQTPNTEGYFGGNIIVAEGPQDPRVAVTIFSTKDTFDRRDAAKGRIEAYLAPGPEWPGYLLENHIAGQRSIQLFQQVNSEVVPVGHTLLLLQDEGLATQKSQYVRTTRVVFIERTFIGDDGKPYQAWVVTCDISDPLRTDFKGSPPSRFFDRARPAGTMTRDTVVADAASYFGVARLAEPVAVGDVSARVGSIFTQLVPSAQTEIPIVDFSAVSQRGALVDGASGTVSYATAQPFNSATVLLVGNSILPGTLSIAAGAAATLSDDGGQLYDGATAIGTVDYARGEVRFAPTAPTYNGAKSITFRPAGVPLNLAETAVTAVTQETRAFNYIKTIEPAPTPGSMVVSYRSNGKWFDLKDNGAGRLAGSDSGFGSGTVSYATGTVAMTTGALPDVGSAIIYAWGGSSSYINRSGLAAPVAKVKIQLEHAGVAPGTVVIAWNDGAARAAQDDQHGNLTGDAGGTVRYQTGGVELHLSGKLPAGGQEYTIDYSYGPPETLTVPVPEPLAGVLEVDLGATDILPNTVDIDFAGFIQYVLVPEPFMTQQKQANISVRDNGAGGLTYRGAACGTINYASGIVLINLAQIQVSYNRPTWTKTFRSRFPAQIAAA